MNILFKSWFNIYHSYSNVAYFLLKYLKRKDIKIYIKNMPFYRNDWKEVYKNDLELEIYENQKIDLIVNMFFPYVFDKNIDIPQIIFFTTEFPVFSSDVWNISQEEIKFYIDKNKLFLLTPSEKSAKPLKDLGLPVHIIPHGFDKDVFYSSKKNYRDILNIKENQKVFLNVSSCTGNKNLHFLIKSFLELIKTKKYEDSVLIIKGIDSLYLSSDILNYTLQNFNIQVNEKNFRFIFESLNFSEMNKLYNTANIYISCGIDEGFDVPIIEAKACDLIVFSHKNSPSNFLSDETYENEEDLVYLMKNEMIKRKPINYSYEYQNITYNFLTFLKKIRS